MAGRTNRIVIVNRGIRVTSANDLEAAVALAEAQFAQAEEREGLAFVHEERRRADTGAPFTSRRGFTFTEALAELETA